MNRRFDDGAGVDLVPRSGQRFADGDVATRVGNLDIASDGVSIADEPIRAVAEYEAADQGLAEPDAWFRPASIQDSGGWLPASDAERNTDEPYTRLATDDRRDPESTDQTSAWSMTDVYEPTPEPGIEPTPEPVIEPASWDTTDIYEPTPVTEPAPEPTLEPTLEPAPEPVVEPVVEPTAEPTPEPVVESAPEPITGFELNDTFDLQEPALATSDPSYRSTESSRIR